MVYLCPREWWTILRPMTAVQHRADSMLKEEWILQVVFNVYLFACAVSMFHG